jgi:hypothetical protein
MIQLFFGLLAPGLAADRRDPGGVSEAALGRGLPLGASRISSISLSLYKPAGPIYLKGFIPFLWNLLLTASEDIPSGLAISTTGIPSMFSIISIKHSLNQGKNGIKLRNKGIKPQKWSERYSMCIKTIQINFFNFFE